MSRRDHESVDDELAEWLAQLGEPPPDEDATAGPATGPADPPNLPTVPPDPEPSTRLRQGDDDPPRSSRRLWLLAALPWLVMAVAALAAWADVGATDEPSPRDGPPPDSATAGDGNGNGVGSPGSPQPQDDDAEPAEADPASEAGASEPIGAGESPAGELAAAAEAAVRTVGARQLAGADDAAVHVGYTRATETSPLGDGAVVTVAALVRRATDGEWGEPDPLRFAVVLDRQGRLREPPWPLPGAELTAEGPGPAGLEPVDVAAADDLVDAASDALTRAGYDAPDVQALHRVGDQALRVEALARPPGARARGAVVAWLTPDARRVLGHRAAASGTPGRDQPDP